MGERRSAQDESVLQEREDSYINASEQQFLSEGIIDYDFRLDGRGPLDYRTIHISIGEVLSASGSARVTLGETCVLATVKTAIKTPSKSHPDFGFIEFSIDSSPLTSHKHDEEEDESRSPQEARSILQSVYQESGGVDRRKLCIVKGSKCWALFFDLIIFEKGTSLLDAASLAVKAALFDTKFANVTVVEDELDQFEVEFTDDPYDYWQMDATSVPVVTSLHKIGPVFLVDVTKEEQVAANASVVIATNSKGTLFYQNTDWKGSQFGFELNLIDEAMETACRAAAHVDSRLMSALISLPPPKSWKNTLL
ncbi:hypothetical protein RvY_07012 [Ramazzottius varieornatus]|uniref:Ribosomal RNA-processing protein 42 n=1 Tax=Ramazzottius varieornatus TaxID=947166 RepID=A0A1D1VA33_RAMVA|nr:hypothetical protein RvY_07012 [Ramazzottius varieornatus]